jgi:hypothetical protein
MVVTVIYVNENSTMAGQFFIKFSNIALHEIRLAVLELLNAHRQTEAREQF